MITNSNHLNGHNGQQPDLEALLPGSISAYPTGVLSTPSLTTPESPPQFTETGEGTVWHHQTAKSLQNHLIANFTARITHRYMCYGLDGRATIPRLCIALMSGAATEIMEVTEQEFQNGIWAKKIPYPYFVATEVAKAAIALTRHIQRNSRDIAVSHEHTRFGLTRLDDGSQGYVTCSGAITATGFRTDVRVVTDLPELEWRRLPEPLQGEPLVQAIRTVVGILDAGPLPITYALLAFVAASVLGRTRFSIHLAGGRDTRKTSLLRLGLSFWGGQAICPDRPIFGWSATANAAELTLQLIANGIIERDDFVPGAATSRLAANRDADRVFRAAANHSNRTRLSANGTLRPSVGVESAQISTGEAVPAGESLRVRMLILEVQPKAVNCDVLTQQQNAASEDIHAAVMATFLQQILPTINQAQDDLERFITDHRADYAGIVAHEKHADAGAHLTYGLQMFFNFAVKNRALTPSEAHHHTIQGQASLRQLLQLQSSYGQQADPTERFREGLRHALIDGRAYLEDEYGRPPVGQEECCGWRPTSDGWTHHGRRIGWTKKSQIYLEPGAAYETVKGERLVGVSQKQLDRMLRDRGALASTDQDDRHSTSVRLMIHGHRIQVLHLRRDWLFDEGEEAGAENKPAQTTIDDDDLDLSLLGE